MISDALSTLVDERGITVVIVTHEQEVAQHARRTIRMRDGRIEDDTGGPVSRPVAGEEQEVRV